MKHRLWLVSILLLALVVSAGADDLIRFLDLPQNDGLWNGNGEFSDIFLSANAQYYLKADVEEGNFPTNAQTYWTFQIGGVPIFENEEVAKPTPYIYYFTVETSGYYNVFGHNDYFTGTRVNLYKQQ